jgi:DNA-binding IclR family transcriptional regulator
MRSKKKQTSAAAPTASAPALDKGLDLIEALAAQPTGLNQKEVARSVGRSVNEIFRMLGTLERRGYVTRDAATGEYSLTLKLFRIASQYPPTERLLQAALPVMEGLAGRIAFSCHLTILSGDQFMVLTRIEPAWLMGWSVKQGAVFPLSQQYASAKVLAAFQLHERRRELTEHIARFDRVSVAKVAAALDKVVTQGGNFDNDNGFGSILAYSCPILEASGRAVAALTVPLLRLEKIGSTEAATIAKELKLAARAISEKIGAREADD